MGRFLSWGRSAEDGGDLAPDNPGKPAVHHALAQFVAFARARRDSQLPGIEHPPSTIMSLARMIVAP